MTIHLAQLRPVKPRTGLEICPPKKDREEKLGSDYNALSNTLSTHAMLSNLEVGTCACILYFVFCTLYFLLHLPACADWAGPFLLGGGAFMQDSEVRTHCIGSRRLRSSRMEVESHAAEFRRRQVRRKAST